LNTDDMDYLYLFRVGISDPTLCGFCSFLFIAVCISLNKINVPSCDEIILIDMTVGSYFV